MKSRLLPHALVFAVWAATCAQVAFGDEMRVFRNIAYARENETAGPLNRLDAYAPASGADHPVVVWIHGGGWRRGDKANVQLKPKAFVDRGFAFVSVNYRLHPAVDYKEQAGDIAKAIKHVHANATRIGGSPDRIYLMGHSAGAHLAALVATDERYLEAEQLPLATVKGVILLDGAGYDISQRLESAGPRGGGLYRTVFGADEVTWKDASPISHVAEAKGIPPFLILHVADRVVSKLMSEGFAQTLRQAGVSAKVVPAEGKTHATINHDIGKLGDEPSQAIFEFLEDIKKRP